MTSLVFRSNGNERVLLLFSCLWSVWATRDELQQSSANGTTLRALSNTLTLLGLYHTADRLPRTLCREPHGHLDRRNPAGSEDTLAEYPLGRLGILHPGLCIRSPTASRVSGGGRHEKTAHRASLPIALGGCLPCRPENRVSRDTP